MSAADKVSNVPAHSGGSRGGAALQRYVPAARLERGLAKLRRSAQDFP